MSSLELWRSALQPPEVVAFFRGLFVTAGVRVTDTGETFTCRHLGDRIEFLERLDETAVDFTVEITAAQVARLVDDVRDGVLDDREQFRIMAALASPATRAALQRPIIRNRFLRALLLKIGRAEPLMHVVLTAPAGEEDVAHTIAYSGGQYLVVPGRHGRVPHVYRLTVADAIDYQRRMLAARRDNSLTSWLRFARWYGQMRRRVIAPA